MQTYQNMKDSGVGYIRDIPADWDMLRASLLFKENKKSNSELTSIKPMQFRFGNIIEKNIYVDSKVLEDIKRYTVVNRNDIMVNGLNLNYDFLTQRVAIVTDQGCITPAYISMQTSRKFLPMFACYLLKALDDQKVLNSWGTGIRLTLNFSEFKKYYLPVPPLETQQRVIDYLDKETAKIDNLISKQENLLKLLEEKRRATLTIEIERTDITKIPFKRFIQYLGRGASPDYDEKGSTVFINQACIYWQGLDLRGIKHAKGLSHKSGGRGSLQYGDLLLNSTGTGTLGRAAIFNKNGLNYFADSHVTIIRPQKSKLNSKYLKYLIESDGLQDQIYKLCVSGSTNQIELSKERFANLFVSVPSIDEQTLIVQRLDMLYDKIELIRTHTLAQISLLKERRVSLISNVVTGKVRV